MHMQSMEQMSTYQEIKRSLMFYEDDVGKLNIPSIAAIYVLPSVFVYLAYLMWAKFPWMAFFQICRIENLVTLFFSFHIIIASLVFINRLMRSY